MQSMNDFVSYNGKRLRKGYTTGSSATGATLAACQMLVKQRPVYQVKFTVPAGVELKLQTHDQLYDQDQASCSIIKDGGDDQDATHGHKIFSTVTWRDDNQIVIDGGTGVGRITQEGLKLPVGMAAINPVPRQMIQDAVRSVIGDNKGVNVIISVPDGEEVAKQTFNGRLGIVGGISILGTSGIVSPMSEDSWKEAITIEMQQKKNLGYDGIILVPGNYGEDFIHDNLTLNEDYLVQMSNFVGYVLMEVYRIGFEKVLLVGHFGKFIKLAGGIFSTHSKDADARNEIMVANLALMGAPLSLLEQVDSSLTTERQAEFIIEAGYEAVYQRLVDKIKERCQKLLKYRNPDIEFDVIAFLSQHDIVASTKPISQLEEEWQ